MSVDHSDDPGNTVIGDEYDALGMETNGIK